MVNAGNKVWKSEKDSVSNVVIIVVEVQLNFKK